MGLLKTDGVNDFVLFDGASAALQAVPTGPMTIVKVFRRVNTTSQWNGLVTLETSAAVYRATLEIQLTDKLTLDLSGGGSFVGTATTQIAEATDYHLIAASHPSAGAMTITNKNITSGAAVARESSGAQANATAGLGAGGLVRFGMWQTGDPAVIWMVVCGIWNLALTNAQVDECWANKRTSDLWNNSAGRPLVLVEFNTLTPTDFGGNSTFNQVNGPTLDAAETGAGWLFDGTGAVTPDPEGGFSSSPFMVPFFGPWSQFGGGDPFTDATLPVTGLTVNIAQVSETNIANPLSAAKAKALTRVSEVDVARIFTSAKAAALARAVEADSARALVALKGQTLGRAVEVDLARTLFLPKFINLVRASEADSARTLISAKSLALARVSETDLARGLVAVKSRLLTRAVETDIARALSFARAYALARAVETDSARVLGRAKAATLVRVIEIDIAQPVSPAGNKLIAVVRVSEIDTARTLPTAKSKGVARVTEADVARALASSKARGLTRVSEVDQARSLIVAKSRLLVRATEADSARPLLKAKATILGRAVEIDQARQLTKVIVLVRVSGLDVARPLTYLLGVRFMGYPTTGHATGLRSGHATQVSTGAPTRVTTGRPA